MTLGKRIKKARARLRPKVTQKQLADAFGITEQSVSQWERDETVPDYTKWPKLARLLQIPLAWLHEGTGDPPAPGDLQVRLESLSPAERAMLDAMIEALPKHRNRVA